MSIKKFNQFLNEGYNLNTLKSYIDTGNKLWVRVEKDGEDLEVKDIDVKGIHDGSLRVELPSGEETNINHDDIVKTITHTQKNINEDLEHSLINEESIDNETQQIRKYIKNNLSIEVDELYDADGFEIKLLLKDEVISSGWLNNKK